MDEPPNSGRPVRPSPETASFIRKLQARGSRGLWSLALFLAISIGALREFSFLPGLPEPFRLQWAIAPPWLISLALVIYTFSAIVRTFSRMALGSGQYGGLFHVACLAAFYSFYHVADALPENFWAVLVAGTTVLSLESYHVWNYHRQLLRELESILPRLEGRDKK